MQAFIRENAAAFRVFVQRYVREVEVIDDILQEAYMRFWTRRHTIGVVQSPRNYFFSIIKNTIFDKKDYFSSSTTLRVGDKGTDVSDEGVFMNHLIDVEASQLIAQALLKLSPQSRQVILMTLEERQMSEIAEALSVSINTVKTVKYRALKRLSELLSPEDFWLVAVLCHFTLD